MTVKPLKYIDTHMYVCEIVQLNKNFEFVYVSCVLYGECLLKSCS